jgi:hypothetical protein
MLAAVGCARSTPTSREGPRPPIDWSHPLGGPDFPSVAAAQEVTAFEIVVPRWGKPDVVETVPDPADQPPEMQLVALIFHLPEEGTVVVWEQPQGTDSVDHLKQLADTNYGSVGREPSPGPGTPDPVQLVPLRGTYGLLIQGNGIGRVIWLEGGLKFDITGPTVSSDQVLALAEAL